MDAKSERERRLAEALRANLRRRKAQAREIGAGLADEPTPGDEAPPGPERQ
jgi:predicted transcriptional regulator